MVAIIKPSSLHFEAGSVIKADTYQSMAEAADVLTKVNSQLEEARQQAEVVIREARERGYKEGLAQADLRMFERHIKVVNDAVDWLSGLENKLAEILIACLRSTVDEIGRDEICVRMIRKALTDISGQPKVRILTSAAEIEKIKAGLTGRVGSNIQIASSADLKPGESVIESPIGVMKLDLAGRLDQFDEVLHKHATTLKGNGVDKPVPPVAEGNASRSPPAASLAKEETNG